MILEMVQIGDCQIIHGDSLKVMADLKTADAIICDPPYESHMHETKAGSLGIRQDGYESPKALDFASIDGVRPVFMPLVKSLCKGWFIAFCTPEGIAPWRDSIEDAGLRYKRACFWNKPDSAPQFNGQGPAFAVEPFVTAWSGTGVSKWNGGGRRNFFTHPCNPRNRDGRHPTEKPLSLMMELVTLFTNPGDLIIDPFMGSGTTLMAAAMTGRRAIGIELDKKYFDVAVDRLSSDLLISGGIKTIVEPSQTEMF